MKKKIIIGSVVGALIIIIVAVNILRGGGGAFSSGSVYEVSVGKVEKGDITSFISASGVIEEMEKSEIYFDTPLKVENILVEKNRQVTKGQKLVELDMDALNSELEQLRISRSIQAKAKNAEVVQAENAVASAKLAYDNSLEKYEDSKLLYAGGAMAKSEFEAIERGFKDVEMALENAKARYQAVVPEAGTQDLNLRSIDLRIGDLEKKINKINELTKSPFDGVVAEINVTKGGFTSSMQPAFKLLDPDKLQVRADIKEFDVRNVAVGQSVNITGDAITEEDGITGRVQSISSVAKKSASIGGTETLIEVLVSIDKTSPILKPGLSVTCDVVTSDKKGVLLATFQMLRDDKNGNKMVYVVEGQGNSMVMKDRQVKLGVTSELNAEVLDGLQEGEQVVLDPLPYYKDGARIKIKADQTK